MNTIPIIDMRALDNPMGLKEAFKTYGFVAVVNAEIDDQALDAAYTSVKKFFQLPLEVKQRIKSSTNCGERGYVHSESAKGQAAHSLDYKEFLHVGREESHLDYPRNIWPIDFALQEPLMRLYAVLEKLIDPIAQAVAQAIGVEPEQIQKLLRDGDHLLRLVHYPANPPDGEAWAAEHTDIDFFTLLPKASREGLQVKVGEEWIDVEVPPGSLILNAGDMLQNLTNGLFRSAVHRVVAKAKNVERFSIVMFAHAHPDDRMDPLPHCIEETGGVRRYPNASRQQLLEQRIVEMGRGSYEMMQRLSQSGLLEEEKRLGLDCSKAEEILNDSHKIN